MDIKSRIEQIISNNIKIGETENRLDYIVHNTAELAEEIVKLFAIPVVRNNEVAVCIHCKNQPQYSEYGEPIECPKCGR
jgi:uncharacterized CHY-type Zn-finger protein